MKGKTDVLMISVNKKKKLGSKFSWLTCQAFFSLFYLILELTHISKFVAKWKNP